MANPRTIARLEARIKERAAYCLQFEINDPRAGFITILEVSLSSDLSSGKIHYSVLGDETDRSKVAHMLKGAAGFIQRQVARVLEMRRVPHLSWVYDDRIEKAADLDLLIREARQRDKAINPHADDAPLAERDSEGASAPSAAREFADESESAETAELQDDDRESSGEARA